MNYTSGVPIVFLSYDMNKGNVFDNIGIFGIDGPERRVFDL